MRIDFQPDDTQLEAELDTLHARLQARARLAAPPAQPLPRLPWLRLWRHEADGEFYVYVEDMRTGRLAGCTVFNRLVEVNRRLDPFVRSPHSRYRPAYRRLGLATRVYARELDAGFCLVSGARQSPGAHALWHALAERYEFGYARLHGKRLARMEPACVEEERDGLHTRMVLCGKGWTLDRLLAQRRPLPRAAGDVN